MRRLIQQDCQVQKPNPSAKGRRTALQIVVVSTMPKFPPHQLATESTLTTAAREVKYLCASLLLRQYSLI